MTSNSMDSDINAIKEKYKTINLYYKGKELINDEEILANLIPNNDNEIIELCAIILSLNDSTFIDENKTKEKLIKKIVEKCQYHKGNKELYICIKCGVAFCSHCSKKHENHEVIERKNIIKFNDELKVLNEELKKNLEELNISNIFENQENNDLYKIYSDNIEKLQIRLDNIKKIHKGIINNYKRDLDKSLPYLLEYKEKIEQMIECSYELGTIKDDEQFMDYYYWYINIKEKKLKINQEIMNLLKMKEIFNKLVEEFNDKIKNIYEKTDEDYKSIKKIYYNNNENQFRYINSNSKNVNGQNISSPMKLNLFTLLNQRNEFKSLRKNSKDSFQLYEINSVNEKEEKLSNRNMKDLFGNNSNISNKYNDNNKVRTRKRFFTQRFSSQKLGNFERISEKSELEDESKEESNFIFCKKIYCFKPKSQNIYSFDFESKKLNQILVNFNNINIKSFESSQGCLNYNNNFYISGGINSPLIFCKYSQKENIFIRLREMPSFHSYHGMLGLNDFIFVISGYKSKKVERYDINRNIWKNLPELKDSRIWPSCLGYKNKYIFIFGKLNYNNENEDKLFIEKLDISDINSKWECLNFNIDDYIYLPSYFGLININDNSVLLIGGKYNSKERENCSNFCFKININDEKIDIKKEMDFKLLKKEVFNGKTFFNFGDNFYGEFSSSSGHFYLVNYSNKNIEEFEVK